MSSNIIDVSFKNDPSTHFQDLAKLKDVTKSVTLLFFEDDGTALSCSDGINAADICLAAALLNKEFHELIDSEID